ncbi:DoxX family protein [Actinorugispora endophytica]|uniref:DoxX-like protein n=1 Tax=Actinorugispora endophytica TaxID=1605990 RepID=A0A4R6V527_9ACTN|nr:DoxX family protein [Actinorugispora endophytica]TDQ55313.1 DoxX-like protein [Actinorugispora endophytica]
MLIPLVLLTALAVFRTAGALGVRRFDGWRVSAAHAMAVMLLFTAGAHFAPPSVTVMPNSADLTAMVPPQIPFPELVVYGTGVLELAGAAGLVLPATRRAAAVCLALLFALMFPANAYAALNGVELAGDAPSPLVPRALEQVLYIATVTWVAWPARTRPHPAAPGRDADRATGAGRRS